MKHFLAVITVIIVMAMSTAAAEEPDTRNPLEIYRGDSGGGLIICSLTFDLSQANADGGHKQDEQSNYLACIEKGQSTAKASLNKALRTVKKPKAQEALKGYHVAFITALVGIRPGSDELRIDYKRRQQTLKDKVNEAWARFEVEQ